MSIKHDPPQWKELCENIDNLYAITEELLANDYVGVTRKIFSALDDLEKALEILYDEFWSPERQGQLKIMEVKKASKDWVQKMLDAHRRFRYRCDL